MHIVNAETLGLGLSRTQYQLLHWWSQLGRSPDFCLIYNDGNHLFVDNVVAPGGVITRPLTFLRFKDSSHRPHNMIDAGDIWIRHYGHCFGNAGGSARVRVFNSYRGKWLSIAPLEIAYVVQTADKQLRSMNSFYPLPMKLLRR